MWSRSASMTPMTVCSAPTTRCAPAPVASDPLGHRVDLGGGGVGVEDDEHEGAERCHKSPYHRRHDDQGIVQRRGLDGHHDRPRARRAAGRLRRAGRQPARVGRAVARLRGGARAAAGRAAGGRADDRAVARRRQPAQDAGGHPGRRAGAAAPRRPDARPRGARRRVGGVQAVRVLLGRERRARPQGGRLPRDRRQAGVGENEQQALDAIAAIFDEPIPVEGEAPAEDEAPVEEKSPVEGESS